MQSVLPKLILTASVALIASLQVAACKKSLTVSQVSSDPLIQVNDQPKPISAQEVLVNQPDFTAEEIFSEFEPARHAGFSLSEKVAKRGDCYRSEESGVITFYKTNQPAVTYHPKRRKYSTLQSYKNFPWYQDANHVEIFAQDEAISFEAVGAEVIQGHDCIKIRATKDGTKESIFFYAAKDLRNLVIAIEIKLTDRAGRYALRNISFEVADELFTPIEKYKPRHV